ncbi:hypothetical protein VNO77_20100 [Canavalia gladiata]|uniref:Uncharacterized protein n=1 Tax=Canavalia gladiata TaxID=3824 RepID=A0AAN9LNQ9_CANGL
MDHLDRSHAHFIFISFLHAFAGCVRAWGMNVELAKEGLVLEWPCQRTPGYFYELPECVTLHEGILSLYFPAPVSRLVPCFYASSRGLQVLDYSLHDLESSGIRRLSPFTCIVLG